MEGLLCVGEQAMTKPNTFVPGTTAESAKVNENFDYVDSVLGTTSSATAFRPPKSIQLGPRKNVNITAERDTSTGADSYVEFAWNAEAYLTSGVWKVRRFLSDNTAGLWRLGKDGFDVLGTSTTSGDLNAQIEKYFGVDWSGGEERVYIKSTAHITKKDGAATGIQDYRLTYVPLNTPQTVRNNVTLNSGTTTFTASNYGVDASAVAIEVVAAMKTSSSSADWRIMQAASSSSLSWHTGLILQAEANGRQSVSGTVHLGRGSYAGKFVEQRSSTVYSAYLVIKGYWL